MLSVYLPMYFVLWKLYLNGIFTKHGYISLAVFLGTAAATMTVITHFYFNDKSIGTIKRNLPSLGIIVSTREGLELFLKFLVTELSVENLGILSRRTLQHSLTRLC